MPEPVRTERTSPDCDHSLIEATIDQYGEEVAWQCHDCSLVLDDDGYPLEEEA